MNNIAENTAPDAVQSLTPPAVRETNAAAEKPHRAQNTGSKARPATKKLNLTQKILEIKKQVAGVPMIRIAAKELTEAELNELLAIAPLSEIRAEAAELTVTPSDALLALLTACLLSFFASRFDAPKIAHTASTDGIGEIPADAQNAANSPQTGGQGGKEEPRPLSDAQMKRLYRKAEAAGYTEQDAVARILEKYDKTNPALMTRQEYDEICGYYDSLKQPIGR